MPLQRAKIAERVDSRITRSELDEEFQGGLIWLRFEALKLGDGIVPAVAPTAHARNQLVGSADASSPLLNAVTASLETGTHSALVGRPLGASLFGRNTPVRLRGVKP